MRFTFSGFSLRGPLGSRLYFRKRRKTRRRR